VVTKLFNYDSKGKLREWTLEVQDGRYRTVHGLVGGKIQTTEWTQVEETNVGRANHRNLSEQALFEANAIITKQKEQGFRETIEELNDVEKGFDCMLALKWEDRRDEVLFPVYVQPKLDGIRLNVSESGFLSRNKKPFASIPHLSYLIDFCKSNGIILDGELYNHTFKHDFNKITSLVKKTKPSQKDLEDSKELIQYWIYDAYFVNEQSLSFKERFEKISQLLKDFSISSHILVPTHLCSSVEEVDSFYGSFLDEGYEGQMVRTNSAYEQKRSKTLLKRKEFEDSEYEVLEIREGNGNRQGTAGYMVLKNTNGTTFHSNIKGSREWMIQILRDANSIIGKKVTCKYFHLTPDGVPRFPFVISIRDYE